MRTILAILLFFIILQAQAQLLYGVAPAGGEYRSLGTIYNYNTTNNVLTAKVKDFTLIDVESFPGKLVAHNGKFYGLGHGTNFENGVIYEWNPITNTFTIKVAFNGLNGYSPQQSLCLYNNKFYGITTRGGINNSGVIFEWDPITNIYTKKIDLQYINGINPEGGLSLYNGKIYGTMYRGGVSDRGTIFEWDPNTNIYTKKYDFSNLVDGLSPSGSIALYNNKFYGMTQSGGTNSNGVIFEWDPMSNVYTKKIDFNEDSRGAYPFFCSLTQVGSKFYGMTKGGGINSSGVIFEWDPMSNVYTKKIDLASGLYPYGEMTYYNNRFYGMTEKGGLDNKGTIFEWNPTTNTYTQKISLKQIDGALPISNLVLFDNKLYGYTFRGGSNDEGTIFEWDPTTNIFNKKIDFYSTKGSHFKESMTYVNGKFYGVANQGGSHNYGVIYEWDPVTNIYTKRHDFNLIDDGIYPSSELLFYNNKFYGLTTSNINGNYGVIYEWDPVTNIYTKKIDMDYVTTGSQPVKGLTLLNKKIYGIVSNSLNGMSIFEWDPITNIYTLKPIFPASSTNIVSKLVVFNGKLYGTIYNTNIDALNYGTIFEWDPTTNILKNRQIFTTINANQNGLLPTSGLTLHKNKFYGITQWGGIYSKGIIFEWDPITNKYNKKIDLTESLEHLTPMTFFNGSFYGVTSRGGVNDFGTLYEWNFENNMYSKKLDFNQLNGIFPRSSLKLACQETHFTNNTPQNAMIDNPYNFNSSILDNVPVIYSIEPILPNGLQLNTNTGIISGTPTETRDTLTYIITATQNNGCKTSQSLSFAVNPNPNGSLTNLDDFGGIIKIAPNPTSSFFLVKGEGLWHGKYNVSVLNKFGQILYEKQISVESHKEEIKIDISNLSNGIYILQIKHKNQIRNIKILKI